ncbi:PilL N-terminal domain-containing protein [Pseudomonas chlororaphis]|uniref:PFGI-1 class ICE element type IV pilus protein PilL2 n=1 Tax=Pseudomonas chlororaphis TaxID=587753 RepID=UPI001F156623
MVAILAGCTTPGESHLSPGDESTVSVTSGTVEPLVPVVRYGRYTLAELRPEPGQYDLSQQIVDVAMPAQFSATVGDGALHLLQRTGYSLCSTDETTVLYALPLPAAHLHLGPQTLRDALQTLAGPAWRLTLDQGSRQVCFVRVKEAIERPHNGVAS